MGQQLLIANAAIFSAWWARCGEGAMEAARRRGMKRAIVQHRMREDGTGFRLGTEAAAA